MAYSDADVKDYIAYLRDIGLTGDALNYRVLTDAIEKGVGSEQLARVMGYSLADIKAYAASKNISFPKTTATAPKTTTAPAPKTATPAPKTTVAPKTTTAPAPQQTQRTYEPPTVTTSPTQKIVAYSDDEVRSAINQLKQSGLTGDALNKAILQRAAENNVSDAQLARVTGYSVSDIRNYASGVNMPTVNSDTAAKAAATDWAINQYGRQPTADEVTAVKQILDSGKFNQQQINNKIDQHGTEAYNYDVQQITSAFRSAYGRNPTQSELQNAYDNYRQGQISADAVQFNKYTPKLISDFWQSQLAANPNDPDAAARNTINKALELGVTIDELSSATGFDKNQIRDYATQNNLEQLSDYAQLRADNPRFTEMQLEALASDPWAGRYATESPYDLLDDASDVVTLSNGQPIQFTRNLFDALDTMDGQASIRYSDVMAAIDMAKANGTLSDADAENLIGQLAETNSVQEGLAVLSQPKAWVVVDQIYGTQLGQAKSLTDARSMADKVRPFLDQAMQELGPEYTGVAPGIQGIADDATQAGVENFPYSMQSVEDVYKNYDTRRVNLDKINPNASPNEPNSWQSKIIDPVYRRAADIIDANYNPYAMPDQQKFLPPGGAPENPVQRGLDYISRLGNRMATAGNPGGVQEGGFNQSQQAAAQPQPQPGQTAGLASQYQFTPPPQATLNSSVTNGGIAGIGGVQPDDMTMGAIRTMYNIPTTSPVPQPFIDTYMQNFGSNSQEASTPVVVAPTGAATTQAKAGGSVRKLKVPKGRDHLIKQYRNGQIGLKELSAKLKK